jgi:hypothetical protein
MKFGSLQTMIPPFTEQFLHAHPNRQSGQKDGEREFQSNIAKGRSQDAAIQKNQFRRGTRPAAMASRASKKTASASLNESSQTGV